MSPSAAAPSEAGLAHARELREARERQLALIAIAAGNAARRPPAAAPVTGGGTPAPAQQEAPLTEEQRRMHAQISRLGICRPVDPDAPARILGKSTPTAP